MSETLDNPLLATSGLPDFGRIEAAHVVPAVRATLETALKKLDDIESHLQPSWAALMTPIEAMERPFAWSWGPVGHLLGVRNSPELRAAYEEVNPEVVRYSLRVRQSEPIYKAFTSLANGPEWERLSPAQKRIVKDRLKDAELAGIGLQGEQRKRFGEIEERLSQLATQFMNNCLDEIKAFGLELTTEDEIAGFTPTLRHLTAQSWNRAHPESETKATAEHGPWRVTLEFPVYGPFMEHARRRDLREQVYRGFVTLASTGERDNQPLMRELLTLRREKAQLLGKPSFAEVSLMRKMAPSVDAIREMLNELRDTSWEAGQKDLADLQEFKASQSDTEEVKPWDVPFWAERLRESRYAFTDEQIRPYFPFERVLEGLFGLIHRLFGVTIEQAREPVPVWCDDVRFYHVLDERGEKIAAFYLDPYSRPENKRAGAWMDTCMLRQRVEGELQIPVAYLVCNQTPPVGTRPALMTFREVETLFHEFGHGLQHMLTIIEHPDASGINGVEWDAVELPSQFMENWCYHRPVLMGMTRHFETGEPLPEELFEKIVAARTYRAGSMMLRQILFALTDLELHHEYDPSDEETPFDVQRRISQRCAVIPLIPEDRSLCSFQHIFSGGYSAGYYSYKWAEVLSADAFGAFEEAGLDDEAAIERVGRKFRDTVLALGGSRHPMEIFRDFRGREPSPEALLRHMGLVKA
ncbi:MAG: peptidase M3 [Planctomyces sp.]|nr:peptidase M3 [Planctomyces sp.]